VNSSIVEINGTNLQRIEYNGQHVVTLAMIDKVHQRPEGTAGRNFRTNREHFVEGEDYFTVNQPDEIRRLGFERPQGGTSEQVVLFTQSGYLMLVKSLRDALAWRVQRELVNAYFARTELHSVQNSVTDWGAVLGDEESMLRLVKFACQKTKEVAALEVKVAALEPKAAFYDVAVKDMSGMTITEVAKILGFGRNTFYEMLRRDGIIFKHDRLPLQVYCDSQYFKVRTGLSSKGKLFAQTAVTGKGLAWLREKYKNASRENTVTPKQIALPLPPSSAPAPVPASGYLMRAS